MPKVSWLVGAAWLVSAYSAWVFIYYTRRPTGLPPWRDSQTLDLAMLGILGPAGVAASVMAKARGLSKWVTLLLVSAMLILTLVGCLESISV